MGQGAQGAGGGSSKVFSGTGGVSHESTCRWSKWHSRSPRCSSSRAPRSSSRSGGAASCTCLRPCHCECAHGSAHGLGGTIRRRPRPCRSCTPSQRSRSRAERSLPTCLRTPLRVSVCVCVRARVRYRKHVCVYFAARVRARACVRVCVRGACVRPSVCLRAHVCVCVRVSKRRTRGACSTCSVLARSPAELRGRATRPWPVWDGMRWDAMASYLVTKRLPPVSARGVRAP